MTWWQGVKTYLGRNGRLTLAGAGRDHDAYRLLNTLEDSATDGRLLLNANLLWSAINEIADKNRLSLGMTPSSIPVLLSHALEKCYQSVGVAVNISNDVVRANHGLHGNSEWVRGSPSI